MACASPEGQDSTETLHGDIKDFLVIHPSPTTTVRILRDTPANAPRQSALLHRAEPLLASHNRANKVPRMAPTPAAWEGWEDTPASPKAHKRGPAWRPGPRAGSVGVVALAG